MLLYNFKTEDEIKYGMLQRIKNTVDKSENSIVHDAVGPSAVEFQNAYVELDYVGGKINPENLEGLELEDYVYQNANITRKEATYSTTEVEIKGAAGTMVSIGTLVLIGGLDFVVDENKRVGNDGTVMIKVECREMGSVGNIPAGVNASFPVAISGLNSVSNPSEVTNGFDAEDYRLMLDRYYEKIRKPITSANKYHYLLWAKEVEGVGNARCIPLWSGNNTVKVIIIDSNNQNADKGLVEKVQEHIDPNSSGLGEGQAPIGAFCTVVSATNKPIDISVKVVRDLDYSLATIKTSIESEIREYLKSIAFEKTVVSYAKLGALILDIEGVQDYTELTINGGVVSININDEEVATLGMVVVNE